MYFGDNMSMYKIADIISDIRPKFPTFEKNAKNYEYSGNEPAQIKLAVKEDFLREKYNENMLFLSVNWNVFLCQMFSIKKF